MPAIGPPSSPGRSSERPQLTLLTGHSAPVVCAALSPDGRRLATGSYDKSIILWDVESGEMLHRLYGHEWNMTSLAFSPEVRTHTDSISSVAFSPDGNTVAVGGSYEETVKLWDLRTRAEKLTLEGHSSSLRGIVFSPDGRKIATASADGSAKLWDPITGNLLATLLVLPPADEDVSHDWIAFTQQGYYHGSRGADRFIRWSLGAEYYSAEAYAPAFRSIQRVRDALR
jgi:WD40 repeat protein